MLGIDKPEKMFFEVFVIIISIESQNDLKKASTFLGRTWLIAICCTNLHR